MDGTSAFEEWTQQRARKEARKEAVSLAVTAAAVELLLLALALQLTFGILRFVPLADTVASGCLVAMAVFALAMVAFPRQVIPAVASVLRVIGAAVATVITTALLTCVYVMSLPYAWVVARRQYARRHPGAVAWVGVSDQWRRSTWQAKPAEAGVGTGRRTVLRVLDVFVRQRNWFLVIVVVLVLLATVITVVAHSSSVVAPLVYTLI